MWPRQSNIPQLLEYFRTWNLQEQAGEARRGLAIEVWRLTLLSENGR